MNFVPRVLALAIAASCALGAQVPFRYVVTAEAGATTSPSAFAYVEPATGAVTPVVPAGNVQARLATTIALDPADPFSLWYTSGISPSIVPLLTRATVQGSRLQSLANIQIRGVGGSVTRYHVEGANMLITMGGGTLPGLHRAPLAGGTSQQLLAQAGAHDVALLNNKAYVSTWASAMPTTVVEVDLVTLQTRVVGSTYPAARGLATFGVNLLLADDAGDLHLLNPQSGALALLQRANRGAVVAAASDPLAPIVWYATDRNEVWRFPDLGRPVYATANRIHDLDVGVHDRAAFLQFGSGCPGSNALRPAFEFTTVPAIPEPAFALQIGNARATAAAVLALGQSRVRLGALPLPLALDGLGMNGCSLYQDLILTVPIASDASGRIRLPLAIPNDPTLRDAHLIAQGFVVDPGANPANLVASDGGEAILR